MDQERATEQLPVGDIAQSTVSQKRKIRVAMPVWETKQWALVRHALDEGLRIVCFDAEWEYQPPNRVTELGVATLHNGVVSAQNVRIRGFGRRFHGGKTIRMGDEAAKDWLRRTMERADLLVGHALQNDRLKMKQWGCPLPSAQTLPVVDTGTWSRVTNAESANPRRLSHLAAMYGVERKGMHVAGNDALVTLKVAMAMAAIEPAG